MQDEINEGQQRKKTFLKQQVRCLALHISVESFSEKSSSQGMIVHPGKLLIEKTWVA